MGGSYRKGWQGKNEYRFLRERETNIFLKRNSVKSAKVGRYFRMSMKRVENNLSLSEVLRENELDFSI